MSAASQPLASRPSTLSQAEKLIEQLQQKLQIAELRVLVLEERLRLRRIEKYGAGSEKLSNFQLEMLEQESGVSPAEVQAESERPVIEGEIIATPQRSRAPSMRANAEYATLQWVRGVCDEPTTAIRRWRPPFQHSVGRLACQTRYFLTSVYKRCAQI